MKKQIYVATLTNNVEWKGICKHYMHDGKNIFSIRLMRVGKGILEIVAEQKEASEKIEGFYRCKLSTRQFGTEKYETEAEWEEEIEFLFTDSGLLLASVCIENNPYTLRVDTAEDFSDFCQNA